MGTMGRNISMLMFAIIELAGTVGCAVKYFDPSNPFSSAVRNRKISERLGFCGDLFSAAATSMSTALPDALSMAPL